MGLIERVGRAIALGDSELTGGAVSAEARRILEAESPWRAEAMVRDVVGAVLGMGPIQPFLDDPEVTDVLVNGPHSVWVDRGQGLVETNVSFGGDREVETVLERALAPLGLRLDRSSPTVDARLADGSRIHAVLPPAAVDHPLLAIRRFTQRVPDLDALVPAGAATPGQVRRLGQAIEDRSTIIVSGGTGAGKTTLLNLLAARIPPDERVVTIEDAAELSLPGHVVRLEARPPNAEGAGEITIRRLVKSALRLRPDRIVLGEVRGEEALDLIWALNTGHRGSLATVHANSPEEALWRLETLALSGGHVSQTAIVRQLRAAVDLVVQIDRTGRERGISAIEEVTEGNA